MSEFVDQSGKTTAAVRVDPSNVEQLRAWDGVVGDHWTEHAQRYNEGSQVTAVNSSRPPR